MSRGALRLWPHPGVLVRSWLVTALTAVLQGLLLGLLVPILRALLRPEPDLAAATPWLVAAAVGFVVYVGLQVGSAPLLFTVSMNLTIQLRRRLMRRASSLPLGWFTADHRARFVHTVTTIAGHLSQLTVTVGGPVISCLVTPATIVLVTFVVDGRLALVLLVTLPAALLAMRRSRRVVAAVSVDMERAGKEVSARAIEFGQAQPVLRAAGLATGGTERMRGALDDHRREYCGALRRMMVPELVYVAVVITGYVVFLVLAVGFLLDGSLPVPDAVALLVLAVRFLEPLYSLIGLASGVGAMDYLIDETADVLGGPSLPSAEDPVRHVADAGIEFDDVHFGYGAAGHDPGLALAGVSFRCRPGTTTALIGPSGSGKTTVIRLVARFFDAGSGSVRVGGVDVRDYDHSVLLDQIAIVFQDVYLFDTTIEENLRMARPDATDAELLDAARAARLDEVVDRLPGGWHTRVGEAGAQLSGGERQRVSIARAFLKRARIVLIDEAASGLDPENEGAVGQAIAALGDDPERTVIVIAHRPATLAAADQVVALDSGRVTEIGTPAGLLLTGGTFAGMYRQYEHARNWRIAAPAANAAADG